MVGVGVVDHVIPGVCVVRVSVVDHVLHDDCVMGISVVDHNLPGVFVVVLVLLTMFYLLCV